MSARDKKLRIELPRFRKDGERKRGLDKNPVSEFRFLSVDEFIDEFARLQVRVPHLNAWELHQMYFKNVCPRAFFDQVMDRLLGAEISAAEYKGALGALSDPEVREQLLGFHIDYEDLVSAFDVIRYAKNSFKRMEMEEAERKFDRHATSSGSSTARRPPPKVMGS
jgi:hypothetical protein